MVEEASSAHLSCRSMAAMEVARALVAAAVAERTMGTAMTAEAEQVAEVESGRASKEVEAEPSMAVASFALASAWMEPVRQQRADEVDRHAIEDSVQPANVQQQIRDVRPWNPF